MKAHGLQDKGRTAGGHAGLSQLKHESIFVQWCDKGTVKLLPLMVQ